MDKIAGYTRRIPTPTKAPVLTADDLGLLIGCDPKTVRRHLRELPASGTVLTAGRPAAAWPAGALLDWADRITGHLSDDQCRLRAALDLAGQPTPGGK